MQFAIDVCIKRYYHYYLEVSDGANNETIQEKAKSELAYMPLNELEVYADPDLDVEPDDIESVSVDEESILVLN